MAEPLYLGVDVGTSAIKVIAMRGSGDIEASASAPLTLETPQPGWAEQSPDAWWASSVAAIKDALGSRDGLATRVAAIGLSGQMHSSVFLDRDGKVIRPA